MLLLVSLSSVTHAAAYWLEIKGTGKINTEVVVEIIYGNIDEQGIRHRQQGKELVLTGDFKFNVITPSGKKIPIAIQMKSDCWTFSYLTQEQGVYRIIGINASHLVIDRSKTGGENVLPIDYLCAQYTVGTAHNNPMPEQFLDMITNWNGKSVKVSVFNNNAPAKAGVKLRVFNPENWEKELVLDEQGKANFWPTLKGMYMIRQDWISKKSGTYLNVPYTSVRHRCNYCFFLN